MVIAYRSRGYGTHARLGAIAGGVLWVGPPAAGVVALALYADASTAWWGLALGVLWSSPMFNELFRRCYEIRLSNAGTCEFEAPLRTVRVGVHEIVALRPTGGGDSERAAVEVVLQAGRLWVSWPVRDFDDLVELLLALNPGIEVERPAEPAGRDVDFAPTVAGLIRRQPLFAALLLGICGFIGVALLSERFERPLSVLIGLPSAVVFWLMLMVGASKGWVDFED